MPAQNRPEWAKNFIKSVSATTNRREFISIVKNIIVGKSYGSWEEEGNVEVILQWLSMMKYGTDETDFLIKVEIIKKAQEHHLIVDSKASQDLLEALIGRLASTYPGKSLEESGIKIPEPRLQYHLQELNEPYKLQS